MTEPVVPCDYTLFDTGIHCFILQPSKAAVDQHFAIMGELLPKHPPEATMRLLFQICEAERLPAMYFISAARAFWSKNPARFPIRAAYLHGDAIFFSLYEQFVKTLRFNSKRAFFHCDAFEEATAWLLAE